MELGRGSGLRRFRDIIVFAGCAGSSLEDFVCEIGAPDAASGLRCLSTYEWPKIASWMSLVLLLPLLLRPPFYLSIIHYLVFDGQTSALSLGPVDGLQTSTLDCC